MTKQRVSFEVWMQIVDVSIDALAYGLDSNDLDDMPYARWHEDGVMPHTAAKRAIKWTQKGYRPDYAD